MMVRGLVLWLACATMLSSAEDLDALFRRAQGDRAAVVPLILAGSEALARLPPDDSAALAERLAPFCRAAACSPERYPAMERLGLVTHRIVARETPTSVSRRYGVGAGLITRLNPGPFTVGRELKVLDAREPLTLVISRSRFRLFVWRGRILLAVMPVSLGRPGRETPLGTTTVRLRVRNPEWRDPDTGRIFAPKDPGNVLGGYWLGFDPLKSRAFAGIGIHGFTAERPEAWLGTASSHGCVRLTQPDVALVFDLAMPGVRVVVRD
ncbi:MAG: L,D-transpeptidase family protein [Planctomycetes bacterium]|nr:L,D-transpeptidase family protein [Planctomycetota bacterium]